MKCAACRFVDADLVVRDSALCRRCAAALGDFLVRAPDATLSTLWGRAPEATDPSLDEDFEEFKVRVAESVVDARAHLDLAHAFAEMGLASDAIRSAANALSAEVPAPTARRAIELIFGDHAAEGALEHTLRAMRSSN